MRLSIEAADLIGRAMLLVGFVLVVWVVVAIARHAGVLSTALAVGGGRP